MELIDGDGNVLHHQAVNFYRKCIENKLGIDEIQFKTDGTSHLKLLALSALMDVTKITKITGDYNNVRPYLYVDKVMCIKENKKPLINVCTLYVLHIRFHISLIFLPLCVCRNV